MKAALCRRLGTLDELQLEDIPAPEPNSREVLIEGKAAGVSFPDVLMIQGKYQATPDLPFIPGLEMAGVIQSVGVDVLDFKPGDLVFGRATGCFAKEIVTSTDYLWHIPTGIDVKVAAGFSMNYATSWYALRERAGLLAGETLVVLGASGGVGLAAVELGKLLGARVIACASSEAKLSICRSKGADETINYESEDLREVLRRLTNYRGVDVVFDPVGDRFTELTIRSMGWGGRYLVVGFAAGQIPQVTLNLALLKGIAILGVWWGGLMKADSATAHRLMQELIDQLAAGRLKPSVTAEYPLSRARDALTEIAARRAVGKIILDLDA